jgi:hypothetical protein
MPYQSKTYSLSNEVIAAIEAAREQGETPNKFLRRVLGIDKSDIVVLQRQRRPVFQREDRSGEARLDAVGPALSSERGKVSTETYARAVKRRLER